jgi:hypothetical protein
MLIRREVFERIGFLDDKYFAYFEDTDFCYRAKQSGISLFYIPSAHLLHKVSSLTGSDSDFSIHYSVRNHVYYILKNLPGWQRLFYIPAFQIHIVTKFIFQKRKPNAFWMAERAFCEGISIYLRLDQTMFGGADLAVDQSRSESAFFDGETPWR